LEGIAKCRQVASGKLLKFSYSLKHHRKDVFVAVFSYCILNIRVDDWQEIARAHHCYQGICLEVVQMFVFSPVLPRFEPIVRWVMAMWNRNDNISAIQIFNCWCWILEML
jgi:hypothetical protein